jgi:hypothetical protein
MLDMTAAELNVSTFRSNGWTDLTGGVKTVTFNEEGFWQAGTGQLDPEVFPNLGTTKVFTMTPIETETSVAYLWRGGEFHYEPMTGSHGDPAGFLLSSVGKDGYGVVRGKLGLETATVSGTGQKGSIVNIATTSASGYAYASLHAFTVGVSSSVVVESTTDSAMVGTATTLGTFTVTAAGGNWMTRVAATSGQNYYRFRVTGISNGTGTFSMAGAIGVQ